MILFSILFLFVASDLNKYSAKDPDFMSDALEPYIQSDTIVLHQDIHHDYAHRLSDIASYDYYSEDLVELINNEFGTVMELADKLWSHDLYFESIGPRKHVVDGEEERVPQTLLDQIEHQFGDFDTFQETIRTVAGSLVGDGWVYIVKLEEGEIGLVTKSQGQPPILLSYPEVIASIDCYEHAYEYSYEYRGDYIDAVLKLLDYDVMFKNYVGDEGPVYVLQNFGVLIVLVLFFVLVVILCSSTVVVSVVFSKHYERKAQKEEEVKNIESEDETSTDEETAQMTSDDMKDVEDDLGSTDLGSTEEYSDGLDDLDDELEGKN